MAIDPLNNIENAADQVKRAKTDEARLKLIQGFLKGQPDPTKVPGKELLHRRALFCTLINRHWPGGEEPDEELELVEV